VSILRIPPHNQINLIALSKCMRLNIRCGLDRRTRGTLIEVEVRRECAHKSIDVSFHQCHDKVEIAGHARLDVISKRKSALQHDGNIGCAQPLADYSENIEFLGHDEESKRLDTVPQP